MRSLEVSRPDFVTSIPMEVMDTLPIRIYAKDLNGRFTYMNETCARELGVPSTRMFVQQTDLDFFDKQLAEEWLHEEAALIAGGPPLINKLEEELYKDGRRKSVVTSKTPIRDPDGTIIGVLGMTRDVTHQQLILNSVPCFVFVKVPNKDCTGFVFDSGNEAVARGYGLTTAQLRGKTDAELGNPGEAANFHKIDWEVYTNKVSDSREEQFTHKELGVRTLLTTKVPLIDRSSGEERILGILGVSSDITDQKAAYAEIHKRGELLRHILENVEAGIFFKDCGGRFITVNRALANLVGEAGGPAAMEGRTDFHYFKQDYAQSAWSEEQDLLQTGEAITDKVRTTVIDGRTTIRRVSKFRTTDLQGNVTGLVGISHDITELMHSLDANRRNSELLERVLNALPQKVYVKDAQGRITLSNQSFKTDHPEKFRAVPGFRHQESEFWTDQQTRHFSELDRHLLQDDSSRELRVEQVNPSDGRETLLEMVRSPLHDHARQPESVLVIYNDLAPPPSYERTRQQTLVYLTNQILDSHDNPERRLFLLLLALTHVHGAKFNRALAWTCDRFKRLSGRMAIGQRSKARALRLKDAVATLERIEIEACVAAFDQNGPPDQELATLISGQEVDLARNSHLWTTIEQAERTDTPHVEVLNTPDSLGELAAQVAGMDMQQLLLIIVPIQRSSTIVICCDNVREETQKVDGSWAEQMVVRVKRALEEAQERDSRRTEAAEEKARAEVMNEVRHNLKSALNSAEPLLEWTCTELQTSSTLSESSIADLQGCLTFISLARRLMKRMGDFSTAGDVEPAPESVTRLVQAIGDMFPRRCEFRLQPPDETLGARQVEVDLDLIQQCALELFDNSLSAGAKTVSVSVLNVDEEERVRQGLPTGEWLHIHIEDDGPGIPAKFHDDPNRIFNPWIKGAKSSTGFGLAIARKIVVGHNGRIIVLRACPGAAFGLFFRILSDLPC